MNAPRRHTGPLDALFLQPPSPPRRDVLRDFAGGFGIALPSARAVSGHGEVKQPFMSLVYASASARLAGMHVAYLDAQAESLSTDDVRARVRGLAPSVVVSVVSLPSFSADLALLRALKEETSARVVVCGAVCKAGETLGDVLAEPAVDAAVSGDPEVAVGGLLERLLAGRPFEDAPGVAYRGPRGEPRRSSGGELTDLGVLPLPALDMLPMERYRTWEFGRSVRLHGREFGGRPRFFPLYLSRGCPYGCDYCPYPMGFGRRWRRKSVEQVTEEVRRIVASGARRFYLRDQTVSEDIPFLQEVCRALVREKLASPWICEARPGSLDTETLRLMRASGCARIHYGVETGDATTFVSEAKRGIEPAEVERSLRATAETGILPSLHFLIGFPHDGWPTVSASLDLIGRCNVTAGDCALMTPYPGTRHFRRMQAEDRILARTWEEFTGCDPIVRLDGLSPVELVVARWRVLNAITDNNPMRLRRRVATGAWRRDPISEVAALVDSSAALATGRTLTEDGRTVGGAG